MSAKRKRTTQDVQVCLANLKAVDVFECIIRTVYRLRRLARDAEEEAAGSKLTLARAVRLVRSLFPQIDLADARALAVIACIHTVQTRVFMRDGDRFIHLADADPLAVVATGPELKGAPAYVLFASDADTDLTIRYAAGYLDMVNHLWGAHVLQDTSGLYDVRDMQNRRFANGAYRHDAFAKGTVHYSERYYEESGASGRQRRSAESRQSAETLREPGRLIKRGKHQGEPASVMFSDRNKQSAETLGAVGCSARSREGGKTKRTKARAEGGGGVDLDLFPSGWKMGMNNAKIPQKIWWNPAGKCFRSRTLALRSIGFTLVEKRWRRRGKLSSALDELGLPLAQEPTNTGTKRKAETSDCDDDSDDYFETEDEFEE